MTGTELPSDLIGLAGLVVLTAGAPLAWWFKNKLGEVHESTVNSHGTDLRHDVDEVLTLARDIQTMVRGVQAELHDERERSILADAALHRDLDTLRGGEAG